jgi:molecular chaperone DnaK
MEARDTADVKAKSDALRKVLQEVGTAVYQQAQPAQGAEGGQAGATTEGQGPTTGQGAEGEGTVTDADYKVVDEDKK